ncbi:hypothetical protein NEDG_02041 [Nematocida displodere]|uniref:RING-type domain-containing protein n=1 Tax=Nematocida displodere TaxID=1805483 RepID=A0A177ELP1_9MICR|nr:hypothetical protein NEDG_02041 [Nematocida displodere]
MDKRNKNQKPNPKTTIIKTYLATIVLWTALASCREGVWSPLRTLYTPKMAAFFNHCNILIQTQKEGSREYIQKKQTAPQTIHLDGCTLEGKHKNMGKHFFFTEIAIVGSATPVVTSENLNQLTKLLTGLGTLRVSNLTVASFMFGNEYLSLYTQPLVRLKAEHLTFEQMSSEAITWVIRHVKMSKCTMALTIRQSPLVRNLKFLDEFLPRNLLTLTLATLPNIKTLICNLLQSKMVEHTEVILSGLPESAALFKDLCNSTKTNTWNRARMFLSDWVMLSRLAGENTPSVKVLTLEVDTWEFMETKPSTPSTLTEAITFHPTENTEALTEATVKDLLVWTNNYHPNIETLQIRMPSTVDPNQAVKKGSYFDTLLSKLTTLTIGTTTLEWPPEIQILYLTHKAYSKWRQNALVQALTPNSRAALAQMRINSRRRFSPPPNMGQEDVCAVCLTTFKDLGKKTTGWLEYVCVLDEAGHTICHTCLDKMAKVCETKNTPLCCPLCRKTIAYEMERDLVEMTGETAQFRHASFHMPTEEQLIMIGFNQMF